MYDPSEDGTTDCNLMDLDRLRVYIRPEYYFRVDQVRHHFLHLGIKWED